MLGPLAQEAKTLCDNLSLCMVGWGVKRIKENLFPPFLPYKVTGQAADLHSLQQTTSDLRSRLTMAELLHQQLSATPSSPGGWGEGLAGELEELRGEVGRLEGVVRSVSGERDQALGDLDALREAMIQQRQDSAQRVSLRDKYMSYNIARFLLLCLCQLSELHSRLAESEAERLNLSEQLSDVSQRQCEMIPRDIIPCNNI